MGNRVASSWFTANVKPRRSIGRVKFFKAEKGWGAISSPDLPEGRDACAHFSALDMDGYRALEPGQQVELTWRPATQDSFEFVADWVRVID